LTRGGRLFKLASKDRMSQTSVKKLKPRFIAPIQNWLEGWVYRYYERRLNNSVKGGKMPRHIGLILDGNRRWAREAGLEPIHGHEFGFEKLKEVLKWCWELGIDAVTIYALSTENLERPKEEVRQLFDLAEKGFREILENEEIHKNQVRVRALGRLDLLSESLNATIREASERTKGYSKKKLNVAIAYGGRAEIIDATRTIARAVASGRLKLEEIDEKSFSKFLYTEGDEDPDLIIRTSGEERLSGFLLWQSAYSEFYFMDIYWPELRKIDFLRAIRTFQQRQRRFGR